MRDAIGLLVDRFFGDVLPARPQRPLPDLDPRSHALRAFARFLSLLDFARTGNKDAPPLPYRVPYEHIHRKQPPDPKDLVFPSLAFLPGRGVHDQYTLGPSDLVDGTLDRYAPGAALLALGEYIEPFTVEAWGSTDPERRGLLAGVEAALRLGQRSNALRLKLPDYYDRVASFSLVESQSVDDPDVVRGRMRGQVFIELRVPEVLLVDAVTMRPYVQVEAYEATDPCAPGNCIDPTEEEVC